MQNSQYKISEKEDVVIVSFRGNCNAEGLETLSGDIEQYCEKGLSKYVFDFSECKLLNSPAMGELLDALLIVDRDYEGHIIVSGLDSLKNTLFSVCGIIPLAQKADNIKSAIETLKSIEKKS